MKIEIAAPSHVDAIWHLAGPMLARVADRCGDDVIVADLWAMCRSGNAFLVLAYDESAIKMAAVVRFEHWANGAVLRVVALAGDDIGSWAESVKDLLANMARDNGASRIVAEGRDGWVRIFSEPKKLRSLYVMEVQ